MSFRSFALLLIVSVVFFSIGCGGGGGGGGIDLSQLLAGFGGSISGKVYDNGVVANILARVNPQIASGNPLAGADAYLEESPGIRSTSAADGSFTLVDVPNNKTLHVVVKYIYGGSDIFRARSEAIFLSGSNLRREVSLGVQKADQTLNFVLKDSNGNVLPNGTVTIWGETFQADAQGKIRVVMASGSFETIFSATGYQGQSQTISFSPTSQTDVEIGLGPLGSTNRSPQVYLKANSTPTISPRSSLNFSVQGSDPDGDRLSYAWSTTLGALATASTDGTAMSWLAPDYDTIATITVVASDGRGGRSAASMKVTVGNLTGNREPVVTILATASHALFGQEVGLAASGTDLDGDPITYAWSADAGTLSSTTGWLVSWQAPPQPATATITLSGADGRGGTGKATLQIPVTRGTNNPPTVQIQQVNRRVYPGQVISLAAVGSDSDGDVLRFTWISEKGTFLSPNGDHADWAAPPDEGPARIHCVVNDGYGGIGSDSLVFLVGNSPPLIELVSTSASALPSETLGLTASGTSLFGDPLNYFWTTTGGILSTSTGKNVFWTAPPGDGIATVSVLADSGGGRMATATRAFMVGTNQPPTANVLASFVVSVASLGVQIACVASDPNLDFLSYSWTATGGSFIDANQAATTWIAGSGPATYSLTCNVSDGRGGSVSAAVTITVFQGRNLAVGEVAHFLVNNQTTIFLGTPTGTENFGVIFYPLNTASGTYRFDVNGGGGILPDIQPTPPQNSIETKMAEARSRADSIMRGRERILGRKIRSSIQYSMSGKILAAETNPGDVGVYRFAEIGSSTYANHTFTLKVVGTFCKIFLDSVPATDLQGRTFNSTNTTQAMLDALASEFDSKIFNFIQSNYGRTWDKNSDGKVSIFLSPAVNAGGYGLMGFFNPEDFTDSGNSNKRDCFYMCVYDPGFFPTPARYSQEVISTLVHEFQHLVNFVEHTHYTAGTEEDSWLTEGLSMESEIRYTNSRPNHFDFYASAPENVSITNWEQELANYGGAGLFARYLFEQVGTATIKTLVQSSLSGVANIDNRCASRSGFNGVFKDWTAAIMRWGKGLPANSTYDYAFNVAINLTSKTHTRFFGNAFSGSMKSTALRLIKYLPSPGFSQKLTSIRVRDVDNGQMGVTVVRLAP